MVQGREPDHSDSLDDDFAAPNGSRLHLRSTGVNQALKSRGPGVVSNHTMEAAITAPAEALQALDGPTRLRAPGRIRGPEVRAVLPRRHALSSGAGVGAAALAAPAAKSAAPRRFLRTCGSGTAREKEGHTKRLA